MSDLEDKSRKIISIINNMSNENKSINSIMARKDDIDRMVEAALAKKKKEVTATFEKNNEVERTILKDTDDKTFEKWLEGLMSDEEKIKEEISFLQKQQRELSFKLAEVLEEKENLIDNEMRDILQKEKRAEKLKKLVQLYANFTRIRWLDEAGKKTGFVSLSSKEFQKLSIDPNVDRSTTVNQTWEKISKAILEKE